MSAWTKNKVDSSQINGGQEYTRNDNLSLEQLNAITNNSLYAVDKADEALIKADSAFKNNGTIVDVEGIPISNLSFDKNPQEQLDNKENKSEVIYDMTNPYYQVINGEAYTSGVIIDADNVINIPIDTNLVKTINVYIECNEHSSNWYSDGVNKVSIDYTQKNVTGDNVCATNLTILQEHVTEIYAEFNNMFSFRASIGQGGGVQNLNVRGMKISLNSYSKKLISTTNNNVCNYIRITKVEVIK